MKKIVIDTNILLGFYDTHKESIKVLKQLESNSSYILWPNLVFDEFRRNKNDLLDRVISDFTNNKPKKHRSSALIQSLQLCNELESLWKKYQKKFDAVAKELKKIMKESESDVVFQTIDKLYKSSSVEIISYDDDIINKAQKRHLLGNPPGTNVTNICDETIWETLLEKSSHDIVLITRDKSFLHNSDMLTQEYNELTEKKLIKITEKITDALILIGKEPSEEVIAIENEQVERIHKVEEAFVSSQISSIGMVSSTGVTTGGETGKYYNPNLFNYPYIDQLPFDFPEKSG